MSSYLSRAYSAVTGRGTETDADKMRKTNETVADLSATTRELEVQRAYLRHCADTLKREAMEADQLGDEDTKAAKVREWQEVQAQMQDLDALAANQRVVQSTMQTAALNARIYANQRDAAAALKSVSEQVKPHEVDKTADALEASMDNAHATTSALRRPLKSGHPGLRHARRQNVDDVMASWSTSKKTVHMPDVIRGTGANDNNVSAAAAERQQQSIKK